MNKEDQILSLMRAMNGRMDIMSGEIADIREVVVFLKDNAVTRQEFYAGMDNVKSELRGEMRQLHSNVMGHIDGFAKQYERVDHEVTALHHRVDILETKC